MATQLMLGPGVEFTETMRGYLSREAKDDYQSGFERGKQDSSPFEFTVTVTVEDVEQMIRDPQHSARLSGNVTAPAVSAAPLTVTEGTFHLLVRDPELPRTRKMIYRMRLSSTEGTQFYMQGFKTIHDDRGPDLWSDTTTLYVDLHEGDSGEDPLVGKGILHIHIKDFRKQLISMRAINSPSRFEGIKALAKFGRFFTGALSEIFGGPLAPVGVSDAPPRQRRTLRLAEPDVFLFDTSDGVRLKLTRYQGGTKGPVILTSGFGTSTLAYTIDTTDTNFSEYLFEHGYDVWLLDYRASPDLPSATTQFSLDDIATKDYPAAVEVVRDLSGAPDVQVVAHCVGSATFLMALASGLEGVRSGVASQLTLHPRAVPLNRLRSGMKLGNLISMIGVDKLTTEIAEEPDWTEKLYDMALRLYPAGKERCNSPVCRRILFMYGEVYDHDQLNDATHEAIHEMFGVANLSTLKHITASLNHGRILTADGEDVYLPHVDRLKIPLAFLHGEHNRLFLPEGSELTYRLLCDTNGPGLYVRHVVPGYAHMDCFIGKNAARDVFPLVTAELDKHNPA